MIVTGALLFLLGTSVSAGPFLRSLPTEIVISKQNHELSDRVKLIPSSHRSSIIENYIQEGTNVFFKPQFILSAEQMPPQLQPMIAAIEKDDCKKTYPLIAPMVIDEPLRVVEQEINAEPVSTVVQQITEIKPATVVEVTEPIPEPPKLSPIPELSVIVEEPMMDIPENVIVEINEPREPAVSVVIPPGPVLPPMEPPKVLVEEAPVTVELSYEPPTPIAPVYVEVEEPKEIIAPIVIPAAPVLPPMELPKLPVLVEESQTVAELPYDHLVPIAPVVDIEEPKEVEVSVLIPPAPVSPPMEPPKVLVEEAPITVELLHERPTPVAPVYVEVEEPKEIIAPIVIPAAPVLPPMELPKLPVLIEESQSVPELPCEHLVPIAPVVDIEEPKEVEVSVLIPPAPVLPSMDVPKLPILIEEVPVVDELNHGHPVAVAPVLVKVEDQNEVEVPVMIPPGPVLPPFEIPKLPVLSEEEPIVNIPEEVQVSVAIPPGPVLPPIDLPKLPVLVEEAQTIAGLPCDHLVPMSPVVEIEEPKEVEVSVLVPPAPVLPPMDIPKLPLLIEEAPIATEVTYEPHVPVLVQVDEQNEAKVPMVIPPGPVLPPMDIANVPVLVEEAPFINAQPELNEVQVSAVIPPGPVLPPIELPNLPMKVNDASSVVALPCEQPVPAAPVNMEVEISKEIEVPVVIPHAPTLPPMEMPSVPILVRVETPSAGRPIVIEEPLYVERPIQKNENMLSYIPHPIYIEQNRFVLPIGVPSSEVPVEIPSVPQWVMSSIPNFSKNKHCVNEIIVERLLPKMEKDAPSQVPVPYYIPLL